MTVFTKTVFSFVLLAAGFGLASLFGPPELADDFADALRPQPPAPSWGALRPLDASELAAPAWDGYESTAFQPTAPPLSPQPTPRTEVAVAKPPLAPYGGPAPAWSSEQAAPIASWAPTNEGGQVAAATRRDFGVATAAWREPTAPVGWPTREADSATSAPPSPSPTFTGAPPPALSTPAPNQAPRASAPPIGASPYESSFDTPPSWPRSSAVSQPMPPTSNGDTWGQIDSTPAAVSVPVSNATLSTAQPSTPPYAENRYGADRYAPSSLDDFTPVFDDLTPVEPRSETDSLAAHEPIRHVVTDGDTLTRLAQRYLDSPQRAAEIYQANRQTLTNPELLPIGAELVIPDRNASPAVNAFGSATATNGPRARLQLPQAAPPTGIASW